MKNMSFEEYYIFFIPVFSKVLSSNKDLSEIKFIFLLILIHNLILIPSYCFSIFLVILTFSILKHIIGPEKGL